MTDQSRLERLLEMQNEMEEWADSSKTKLDAIYKVARETGKRDDEDAYHVALRQSNEALTALRVIQDMIHGEYAMISRAGQTQLTIV